MLHRLIPLLLACLASLAAFADEGAKPSAPAEKVTHLPPENATEAQMRAQLEQVRALNEQLRQEREQLQKQLDSVQAEVVAEDRKLKQVATAAPPAESGTNFWLLAGGGAGALLVAGGALWFLRRNRKAAGTA